MVFAEGEEEPVIRAAASFVAQGLGEAILIGREDEIREAATGAGIDIERASATWSTSSFTSYHGQLLSLAVQWGVAIEIERAIKKSARFC